MAGVNPLFVFDMIFSTYYGNASLKSIFLENNYNVDYSGYHFLSLGDMEYMMKNGVILNLCNQYHFNEKFKLEINFQMPKLYEFMHYSISHHRHNS